MAAAAFSFVAADKETEDAKALRTLSKEERKLLELLPEHEEAYATARLTGLYVVGTLASSATGKIGYGSHMDVDQVVDRENFIGSDHSVWVEGVGTSNLTDDSGVDLSSVVLVVAGTKRYTTAFGSSRTVEHFVAINTEMADAVLRGIVEDRGYRLWESTDGKTIIAKFLRKSGKVVTVRFPSGQDLKLPFDKFSETDREWITSGRTQPENSK